MNIIGIIPARYSSTRFPGKPLAEISGKTMIERVYTRAAGSKLLSGLYAATDDKRIFDHVIDFGGKAIMTSPDHVSGTDRIREAAEKIKCSIVVNIQGDEPLIDSADIDNAVKALLDDRKLNVSTLICRIKSEDELKDVNVVKVVVDKNLNALYFSRNFIPYDMKNNNTGKFNTGGNLYYKHIGIYVYRKSFLMKFDRMEGSVLEKTEQLEQLRILENGEKIKTVITGNEYAAVDTFEDIKKVEKKLRLIL
jgi:3-deoxy-manno-octulosonate cytidylyltransferase (CMP-KDO synthetase)